MQLDSSTQIDRTGKSSLAYAIQSHDRRIPIKGFYLLIYVTWHAEYRSKIDE